jgi:glycosyltransferase involved in cell wall biosynthesis
MRILIDCSYINFRAQPSGVPRVVSSYVEWGYRWGEAKGIEVIPVVPRVRGLYVVRPPRGVPPAYPTDRAVARNVAKGVHAVGKLAYGVGRVARAIVRKALHFTANRFDGLARNSIFYRIDERLSDLSRRTFLYVADRAPHPHRIALQKGDILFCPSYWHDVDPAIYRRIHAQGCVIVVLVHDLLPITLAEYYQYPWREEFRTNLLQALDQASAFVCVSEVTRQALIKFARDCGKVGNVVTAHNGYQPIGTSEPTPRSQRLDSLFESKRRPLLMVGSIEPKKGHARVLDALERKWSSGYDRPLAIAGRPGWLASDIVQRIRHSPFFQKKLFWFDDFNDDDLSFAYARCHALIFASLAEGFGLPLIEASMASKPSIVLRTAIAEEILGDFGVFFDDAPDALSVAVDRLEDAAAYRKVQDHLSSFTWPGWRESVAAVFDRLVACKDDWKALPAAIKPANAPDASPTRGVMTLAFLDDR